MIFPLKLGFFSGAMECFPESPHTIRMVIFFAAPYMAAAVFDSAKFHAVQTLPLKFLPAVSECHRGFLHPDLFDQNHVKKL